MRVLLAYDGSDGAKQARDLLADLNLPEKTTIAVAGVLLRPSVPQGGVSPLIRQKSNVISSTSSHRSWARHPASSRRLDGRYSQAFCAAVHPTPSLPRRPRWRLTSS